MAAFSEPWANRPGVERQLDLSPFAAARLRFDYATGEGVDYNVEWLCVEVEQVVHPSHLGAAEVVADEEVEVAVTIDVAERTGRNFRRYRWRQ